MSIILDGKKIAEEKRSKIKSAIKELGISPKLAVIIVGKDPASIKYVSMKEKACKDVGIKTATFEKPCDITEEELIEFIQMLNNFSGIHGILVQLPLPKHINSIKVMNSINPLKDVDCLHAINIGSLYMDNAYTKPCTPAGVVELLRAYGIALTGKKAVIIGRSNITGKPMAELLIQEDCTIEMCHSKTEDFETPMRTADVLVSTIGNAHHWNPIDIGRNQILIDIGTSLNEQGKLVGDFDPSCYKYCSYYTPSPGGVGPMTIAMLLENTLLCTKTLEGII